jgi:hypothetical protein
MSWFAGCAGVRKYYGFRAPFDFRIAIPFLLNVCLLGVLFLIGAFFFVRGELNYGTARLYFFFYLTFLLIIGAVFSRVATLSYAIIIWCALELGVGLGSNIVSGPGDSVFPENRLAHTMTSDPGFIYHSLLQYIPQPDYRDTHHVYFGTWRDDAEAAGVDVASLQLQDITVVHNSLGLRGRELTAADLAKDLIFVYGGSTAYDVDVTQGETWVELLQSHLENKYTILNWGVSGHETAEDLIKTAFYQDIVGKYPTCAIYYEGWNDTVEAYIKNLDSGYADFSLLELVRRRDALSLAQFSPLIQLADGVASNRFDSIPLPPKFPGQSPGAGRDKRLEAVFTEHIKTIAAINKARGVKTIFIGQIYDKYWPVDRYFDLPPLARGEDIPMLVERFKSIMKDTAASIGARYIDPGIANFGRTDFVDPVHLAARGSRKFAALVAKQVGDYCQ